ncbi:hypothetical protein FOZ63_018700 [Perkinsus olseni]|uniref:Immunoglobulin-binding protein 1 n=1 Tax=Perkinsus olseni TaxID=32597 RepID=A0A7J6RQU0_PEROL|nr:hypothetical protein FOZ63_018700 [Perkinsus olseni]
MSNFKSISSFDNPLQAFNYYFHNIYIPAGHPDLARGRRVDDDGERGKEGWWRSLCEAFMDLQQSLQSEGYTLSNNEDDDVEEVHTDSLLLLTLPYVIADCMSHYIDCMAITKRSSKNLMKVKTYLKQFITIITARLKIIDYHSSLLGTGDDRDAKINRRREEKRLKQKYIQYHLNDGKDDDEEEFERDCYISLIKYFTLLSVDEVRMLEIEIKCLQQREADCDDDDDRGRENDHAPSTVERRQPWVVRLDAAPTVAGVGDSRRNRLNVRDEVFKPDVPMPTMTLDQWARLEQQNLISSSNNEQKSESREGDASDSSSDENSDEEAELKARKWDDWKDDHPRGAGNKMTNIG